MAVCILKIGDILLVDFIITLEGDVVDENNG